MNFASKTQIRLLSLGDCNTSGPEKNRFVKSVPEHFAMCLESHGYQVEHKNLGYTMCTSREGAAILKSVSGHFDLVIINFGLVDSWVIPCPRIYVSYYPDNFLKKFFRKLLKTSRKRLRSTSLYRHLPRGMVVDKQEYKLNIENIIRKSKLLNHKINIIIWGTFLTNDEPERNRNILDYNDILENIAVSNNATFIDTIKLLSSTGTEILIDKVHLSNKAAKIIADEIFKRLNSFSIL